MVRISMISSSGNVNREYLLGLVKFYSFEVAYATLFFRLPMIGCSLIFAIVFQSPPLQFFRKAIVVFVEGVQQLEVAAH